MKKTILTVALIPLLLAACESAPNPYPNGPGFYETKIEQDRYRITYRANGRMTRDRVEDFTLLRAADLTLGQGYDWFRVVSKGGAVDHGGGGPTLSLGTGSTSFGRHSAVGVGVGTSFNLGGPPAQALTMEIQMGKGEVPNDREAYDAADVARTVRARL